MNQTDSLSEVKRYLVKTTEAANAIFAADSTNNLRDSWETYLHRFMQTLGRMIRSSHELPIARPWSHQLKKCIAAWR